MDGNLWCQEADCPAEDSPFMFAYGDVLGDVEVVRPLKVMRSFTLYEGRRDEEPVFVKVAHKGGEERLKREANVLARLQGRKEESSHPSLPALLPAYGPSTIRSHPFAHAMVHDQEHVFEILHFVEGSFLREELLKNPQPWIDHVGWLIQGVADATALLHQRLKLLHLMLSPDLILVRYDMEGVPRPVLVDLGMLIQDTLPEHLRWLHNFGLPAYTAPELTYTTEQNMKDCEPATPASDVYGFGLLLYEMLTGRPVHAAATRRDDEVREAVRSHRPKAVGRVDLPEAAHAIVDRTIARRPSERYPNALEFGRDLRRLFGRIPKEKKRSSTRRRVYIGLTAASFLVSLLILLLAFLS